MGKATVRPDGTGSIIRRGSKWKAQFPISDEFVDGKRIRKFASKTFDTKQEAEDWLAEQKTDRNRGEWVAPNKLTVSELLIQWLEIKAPALGPNTLKEYESVIRNRINHPRIGIGQVPVLKLDAIRIDAFYSALRKPGANVRTRKPTRLSETSIKRTHEVLTGCLGWAQSRGLLIKNPCDIAETPKANRAKPKAWNSDQLNRFLAQEDRICKVGPFWLFLAHTGVRLSEALGLLWEDLDVAGCVVSIHRRNIRMKGQSEMLELEGTKTLAGTRLIDFDPGLCLALKEWRLSQGAGGQGLVFPFHSDEVDREFNRRVTSAGVPDYGIHGLRHTHATLLIKAGVPVKVVSERLGHTDVAFTMRQYQTVLPGMQKEAAQTFATLLAAVQ